jgi:hypothetical protein
MNHRENPIPTERLTVCTEAIVAGTIKGSGGVGLQLHKSTNTAKLPSFHRPDIDILYVGGLKDFYTSSVFRCFTGLQMLHNRSCSEGPLFACLVSPVLLGKPDITLRKVPVPLFRGS